MLILYGSQTGCAQEVAERLSRQARRIKLEFQLSAMDSYDIKNLINEKLVVFICSTTGQGEMPDNMLSTWKFLIRKNLPSSILSSIQFAVFGLGDSSYQKYNYSAKKLFKRMQQLGAIPLLDRGDGDDQHELGIDGALDPWIDKLWSSINEKFTIPHFNLLNDVSLPEQTYRVVFDGVDLKVSEIQENIASVISNQRVTPASHFQDVRHLEFDISKSNKTYSAGEVIQFRPKNISSEINSVIDFLNYQDIADKNVTLIPTSKYVLIPKHWKVQSIRQLLESHIDIFGHPKRYFFELLSFFTIGEHSIKLKHLSSAQGQGDLYEYNHKVKRTYFEVIVDFNAVIPIDYIFDLIPDIKPRSFSISSSIKMNPGKLQLLVAIVNYKTSLSKPRAGVCTKWMAHLKPNDNVSFEISKGSMKLPIDNTPIILIGPGTGIAPMRSFLQDRIFDGINSNILVFGARNREMDFFFKDEFESYTRTGLTLFTAFSRDQREKVYVQDRIIENSELIWDAIANKGAFVYLSGNAKSMPDDVKDAFKKVIKLCGNMSDIESDEYFKELKISGRFQQECWS